MNKIAQYLNEHLLGEVSSSDAVRESFSTDGSILAIKPEIVVHPHVTNDIRKVCRFSWQLAEKQHILPITVRGNGSDTTGAAIGKGIIINTLAHLNNIIFISLKNKDQFAHVQPGVNLNTLNETLKSNGLTVPGLPDSALYSTIGGTVSNNIASPRSGAEGLVGDGISRLEVVLANGDLIETTRINKHELNKKKGLQTFEGEIYRKIDGIIEDNKQLIEDKIACNVKDNTGYSGIAKVKNHDGSFDLTPLLVGSQGTLGIISEMVVKTIFYSSEQSVIVATFDNPEAARDAADAITQVQPTIIDLIDGRLFEMAHGLGKKYVFSEDYLDRKVGSVLYVNFNDFGEHHRKRKIKNTLKILSKFGVNTYSSDAYSIDELNVVREVSRTIQQSTDNGESRPSLIDGASVPSERREEFIAGVKELEQKHHIDLPLHIQWIDGIIYTRPSLKLSVVSDKQKTFKLINDYMELVTRFEGCMCSSGAEGRLKTMAVYSQLHDDELEIYKQVKEAFDPFGILNPDVKEKSDLKALVSSLNANYNLGEFGKYTPLN